MAERGSRGTETLTTDVAVQVLTPRLVPLGGLRAMTVRRVLPQRERTLIGAWCFVDHYGPDQVATTGGMSVPPHPHTGLATVSWLFSGEIEHRDSAGHHARVRPGELNLMTAGRGISHSEVSTTATTVLHGVQLWVALPSATRFADPGFEHFAPEPVRGRGWTARVFLGTALGRSSPVGTHSPLLGAELTLDPGRVLSVPVSAGFEHGVLVDTGRVELDGDPGPVPVRLEPGELGYLPPGRQALRLRAVDTDRPVRLLLLGGEPLGESIVMWWNFVGRSHEEIVRFRADWQALIGAESATEHTDPEAFALPADDPLAPIPAPGLPGVRLRSRR